MARGLEAVNVDKVGIGEYFVPALVDAGLPAVGINVGASPTDDKAKQKFKDLRAQVFWTFREWASGGMLAGLTDQTALAQLAGLRYEHDARGRIVIEKKDDARKRGVKSPDRAEAVVLAFWTARRRLDGVLAAAMEPASPHHVGPPTLDGPSTNRVGREWAVEPSASPAARRRLGMLGRDSRGWPGGEP
jgi:hypothetical protein